MRVQSKVMHRAAPSELGSLGLVRRSAVAHEFPRTSRSLGATAPARAPPQEISTQEHGQRGKVLAAAGQTEPTVAQMEPLREALAELHRAHRQNEAAAGATDGRLDQIGLRVGTVDTGLRSVEKSMASLRQEFSSLAKTHGGQTAERTDAVERQSKQLEQSFQEFSTRIDRQVAEATEQMAAAAAALQSGTPSSELFERIERRLSQCEERCANALAARPPPDEALPPEAAVTQEALLLMRTELQTWMKDWFVETGLPEMQYKLAAIDRRDQTEALATAVFQRMCEKLDSEWVSRLQLNHDTIHRCSVLHAASVLRATNGLTEGDSVWLQHPIQQVRESFYMTRTTTGPNGEVATELFPVQDAQGPLVVFRAGEGAST